MCKGPLAQLISNIRGSRVIKSVFLGQCISLLLAGTGVTSQFLAQYLGVNIPTAQSIVVYIALFIVYGIYHFSSFGEFWVALKTRSHIYFPLAVIDVEANYLGMCRSYGFMNMHSHRKYQL